MLKKQLQSCSISKLAGKKIVASYLIKWSNGEKRQEEEPEVVAATQKRKMLCKTRRGNLVITVCRSLSQIHLAAFSARDQIFKAGNYGGS